MDIEQETMQDRRTLRVNSVGCPQCGAPPGEPCYGVRGKPRSSLHTARDDAFLGREPRVPRHPSLSR